MPTVSVVVPTCNRPTLLRAALLSILAQDFTDFEIIVVDDGFKERGESVVASLHDSRIRYVQNDVSLGGSGTRNKGIHEARASLIAFLDDDDEWVPHKLSVQLAVLRKAGLEVGFVFSAVENRYPDRVVVTEVDPQVRDYSRIAMTRFKGFLTSGLLVKREVFEQVGLFDEALPSHQEAELILRIAQKYQGIGIAEPLVRMRMSSVDDHIGGNIFRRIQGREMVLSKHRDLFSKHPHILAKHYFWLALMYEEAFLCWDAYKNFMRSVRYKFSLQVVGHGVRAISRYMIHTIKTWIVQTFLRPAHVGNLLREMYARRYLPRFPAKESISIFDAGCGKGQYAAFLAQQYPHAQITAVDIARFPDWDTFKNPAIEFKEQDLGTYNEVGVRDLVVCIDVLEHLTNNVPIARALARGLKKGGYFYIAVPCDTTAPTIFPRAWFKAFHEWEEDEHVGDQLLLKEWAYILEEEGLSIERARYTFTWWGTFAWEIEFLLRQYAWGSRLNLLLMPMYRFFGLLDIYFPIGKGNNLVVGRKNS